MGDQIMDDLTVQLQRASNCIVNRYCERYKVALESGLRKVANELKKKDRNKSVSKVDVISIIEKIRKKFSINYTASYLSECPENSLLCKSLLTHQSSLSLDL